ncbi:chromatin assembly factor 1 subunit B-like [Achlya hypogyna]|uniref:Chromatin assembly factor 1 subunit B-like n=1 Tax=Achlya hypogyna TaxID=1202772 RepID=A0A1V9ZGK3_ACHHY|nr:chromatin assembly factor 1 subunit B-like [Achlya hypogyna]
MKVDTPEIRWHCGPTGLNEAVLTIDFLRLGPALEPALAAAAGASEPHDTATAAPVAENVSNVVFAGDFEAQVFATGGADKEIKIWVFRDQRLTYVHGLSGHDRSVNCVRFSPDGQYLASASDDSTIVLWTRPKHVEPAAWSWATISSNSDVTRVLLSCGHKGDITDLSWSPDSAYLSSVSIDNTCAIWHVGSGNLLEKRKDHTQFVQGVAWDPLNEFLITEGNDRSCRVYSLLGYALHAKKKKVQFLHTLRSRDFEAEAVEGEKTPKHPLFHDDAFPAFSRRLAWTPDGSYCLMPTGLFKSASTDADVKHTVYAYARGNLTTPAFHLPGHEKGALCVRFSPVLYELQSGHDNLFALPYRFVFAVATLNAVAIYDSQLPHPIAVIDRLHYADLTDMSWAANGQMLCLTSLDGYISFITFDAAEMGTKLPSIQLPQLLQDRHTNMYTNQPTAAKRRTKAQPPAEAVEATKSPGAGKKRAAKEADVTKSPVATKSPVVAPKKAAGVNSILQFTKVVAPDSAFQQPALGPLMGLVATADPTAPAPTHQVQVRKKRKIAPVLVTTPGHTATPKAATSLGSGKVAASARDAKEGTENQDKVERTKDSAEKDATKIDSAEKSASKQKIGEKHDGASEAVDLSVSDDEVAMENRA